ncbi:MAG TPA: hypothetical protein PKH79_14980, partial [Prolixibacteraceae bacterium]|nr:hypothetical protein [Prolixibacteraceae bacterium]
MTFSENKKAYREKDRLMRNGELRLTHCFSTAFFLIVGFLRGVLRLFALKFSHFFAQKKIYHIFASAKAKRSGKYAGIAQLVEHDLAKVGVA